MPHQQPASEPPATPQDGAPAVQEQEPSAYAPPEQDEDWLESSAELPPRPRRRLLSPAPLALLGVLLTACGFIGGVLVEKGQTSSSNASAGGAASLISSRLAALRGGSSSAGAAPGGSGSAAGASGAGSAGSAGGGQRAAFGLGGGGAGRPVSGQVAYLAGSTLYVTDAEGNTLKVKTSPATTVTKTVKASVKGIHPGETVTVLGASAANGSVSAESISVGSGGTGLAALFGGAGRGAAAPSGSSGSSGSSGGGPALFGPGG
jgi:hypothetical protein